MKMWMGAVAFALAAVVANAPAEAAAVSGKVAPAAFVSKPKAQSVKKECRTFIECLFGKKQAQGGKKAPAGKDRATVEVVSWKNAGKYTPGSVVVQTSERALYYVVDGKTARRYTVGVGREGFQWSGNSTIGAKVEWPTWRPPQNMIEREAAKGNILPEEMAGGPNNPLGARAMYIAGTLYRIHGTNNPASVGGFVSSGCIRMTNTDVTELYNRVKIGTKVYVYR